MRVVSLVPSATEMVCLLGAESCLVGRSHECDWPPTVLDRPALTSQSWDAAGLGPAEIDRVVSQTLLAPSADPAPSSGPSLYRLDVDRLQELRPDLIITQDLCSVCSIDLGSVRKAAAALDPVPAILSLNPTSFEGVLDDLIAVARALGRDSVGVEAVVALRERFFRAADRINPFTRPVPTLFLEWTDPLFVAGHWTPQLIERAGGEPLLNPTIAMAGAGAGAGGQMAHRVAGPSLRVTTDEAAACRPEAVIVSPCGIGLAAIPDLMAGLEAQGWWRGLPAVEAGRVALVDGNQMFSRPGPRLVDAYEWLVGWLNDRPEVIPKGFPWRAWPG